MKTCFIPWYYAKRVRSRLEIVLRMEEAPISIALLYSSLNFLLS